MGRVCSHSLAGTVGSNSAGGHECLSLVSVVCYQVQVSAMGHSLVQRVLQSECVTECDQVQQEPSTSPRASRRGQTRKAELRS